MEPSSPLDDTGALESGFLTPRSKVAKMLADIDNAPTPSPPVNRENHNHSMPSPKRVMSSPSQEFSNDVIQTHLNGVSNGTESDSDDAINAVRRPHGRAARRMLGAGEPAQAALSPGVASSPPVQRDYVAEDDEDLYSATPVKPSVPARAASPSPVNSERSGGLFVSPARPADQESEEELPSHPLGGPDKLKELVAKKRAERLAKEAQEREHYEQQSSDLPREAFEGGQDVDPNIEKIMSDATRPSRKASKKALLEMERETQRIARQQALAHQMKVKKRFTTNDLFAKFNFRRTDDAATVNNERQIEGDSTASSAPNSDGIEERSKHPVSTPPSSPPTPLDKQKALVDKGALSKLVPVRQDSLASLVEVDDDEELPDLVDIIEPSKASQAIPASVQEEEKQEKRGLKLARLGKKAVPNLDDSDDELEIIPTYPPHLRVFDKAFASNRTGRPVESKAIHNLKHLSHLNAHEAIPQKKGAQTSINPNALEAQLRRRAKEQARVQQLERIEELRAKGIDIQTAEEREQEAEAFENLLEKARQEAVDLRKAEKLARKEASGEGAVEASSDEDEDYEASESEDEDLDDDKDDKDENEDKGNDLVDEVAEESGEEEDDDLEGSDDEAIADEPMGDIVGEEESGSFNAGEASTGFGSSFTTPAAATRKPRKSRIVADDEDDIDFAEEDESHHEQATEELDDPFAAFNFNVGDRENMLLSPTQAFHATMQTPSQATQEDSFDILRRIAPPSASSMPPSLPDFDSQSQQGTQLNFIAGSQVPESQRVNLNWETQPPETPLPASFHRDRSGLSETPGWEPTQDAGLPSPLAVRRESEPDPNAEHETQSTVQMRVSESPAPSQNVAKRGRLIRRQAALDDSESEADAPPASIRPEKKDAFREMARRRREALTAVERADAEKEMRRMMDEQAEESEDEYAGLGGDDYIAPETEQDKEMIDSSHIDVDERAIAAHFAERQRMRDEQETSKLYKDLTTGMLRKRMGANAFDLDEDEDELAVRRRQMRQREEAKKRKALLKDENIATLAEGRQSKGKDAFLKAIADDDEGDDEVVDLSDEEGKDTQSTQDQSQQSQTQPDLPLQETSGNKRRHPDNEAVTESRPPAKQRRIQVSVLRRPTSLLEVKESVSFLLDEPHAGEAFGPSALDFHSDSENEEQMNDEADEVDDDAVAEEVARQNDGGFAPNPLSMEAKAMPPPRLPASQRRTAPRPAVVDRLSLKRAASTSDGALGRTAWAAGPTTGGFKVPSLLRRTTTSSSTSSGAGSDRGVTTPALSRENSGSVKMGGTKKSSLAYQARAEERRAIVEAGAKRREENTKRIAQLRRNSSALGRGLTGRFE